MPDDVLTLDGTVRARSPEETWAVLKPLLRRYGITRVARLTGLDHLGLPVWTAIRPAAKTLVATQGKGATDLLAKTSAVMEAIELWHVEQPRTVELRAAAADIDLPYPLAALPVKVSGEALTGAEKVQLEWMYGTGLISGRQVPVPLGLVRRHGCRPLWEPDLFRATSTGLACGTTRPEALLHALYEVVERDALFADEIKGGTHRQLIDPASVDDPYCRTLLDRLRQAGVAVEIAAVDNAYAVPVCLAFVWCEDYPAAVFAGSGCHGTPHIALSRAITEAVQSRLTSIAGTRDDLPSHHDATTGPPRFTSSPGPHMPWPAWAADAAPLRFAASFPKQSARVARRIHQVTGHEPIRLILSAADDRVAAVKVICPGARSRIRKAVPR
ncbi:MULTISPECIES: YcaO-like family protein [unclassified Streptomyces]|uniref:YcaO-like family protein n=1 Tax=Streptomyces sp. NBC_00060 TaxID=2975636 RepID=A0AAU2HEH3_9ACTN